MSEPNVFNCRCVEVIIDTVRPEGGMKYDTLSFESRYQTLSSILSEPLNNKIPF